MKAVFGFLATVTAFGLLAVGASANSVIDQYIPHVPGGGGNEPTSGTQGGSDGGSDGDSSSLGVFAGLADSSEAGARAATVLAATAAAPGGGAAGLSGGGDGAGDLEADEDGGFDRTSLVRGSTGSGPGEAARGLLGSDLVLPALLLASLVGLGLVARRRAAHN